MGTPRAVRHTDLEQMFHDLRAEVRRLSTLALRNGGGGGGVNPLPADGAEGQVLAKASATDYDVEWVDQATGGGGETGTWHNEDTGVAAGPGDVELRCTYTPIPETLIVWWRKQQVPTDLYNLGGNIITILDPLGVVKADDPIRAYYQTTDTEPVPVEVEVLVPFGASGWKYNEVTLANSTDFSSASYNDSAWASGTCPFGNVDEAVTGWGTENSVWLRRTFPLATEVVISVPVEDNCTVWVNGIEIGSCPPVGIGPSNLGFEVSVPPEVLATSGSNQVTIRANDEGTTSALDETFVDVQIIGIPD